MDISAEIVRRMGLLGWKAERLSVAAGLNKTYVRDILSGRSSSPKLDKLAKLAVALGCTVAELTGVEYPKPKTSRNPGPRVDDKTDPELLRQAYFVATRVTAEDDPTTRAEATAAYAAAIYDVLVERVRRNQPSLGDDDELLVVMEAIIRRIRDR